MEGTAFANREQPRVQSLSKALDVLEAFSFERPELALGELSQAVGLAKSTVHKLARTLVVRGYLMQDDRTRRYRLGLSNWHLGSVAVAPLDVRHIATPHLQRLGAVTGEQVTLWVFERELAICVDRVDSSHQLRTYTRLGTSREPVDLAAGRCLLAWRPEAELAGLAPDVRARLATVRDRGYDFADFADCAVLAHGCGISAPVRDGNGAVVAAMTVSGPAERFDDTAVATLLPQLLETVTEISTGLGYPAKKLLAR